MIVTVHHDHDNLSLSIKISLFDLLRIPVDKLQDLEERFRNPIISEKILGLYLMSKCLEVIEQVDKEFKDDLPESSI